MRQALIFTGGAHPPKELFQHYIRTRYPQDFNPLVVAADSGLHCAESFGYVPDVIIGDMDSIDTSRLARYPSVRQMVYEKDKDDTDTVLALQEAVRRGADMLLLCGGDGGRIDHLLGIVKQFERFPAPDLWFCREQIILHLCSGNPAIPAVLELPAVQCREHLSVFPVRSKQGVYRLRSEGLVWPLDCVDWEHGGFSLSNRSTEAYIQANKPVRLTAESGAFIVIVPYS